MYKDIKEYFTWQQIWVAPCCVSMCDLYPIHFLVLYLWYSPIPLAPGENLESKSAVEEAVNALN